MDIIVKKGLDLKLVGKPSNEIEQAKFSQDFAVYPADFHGVFPKLVVKWIFYKMELSEKETRILSSVFANLTKKKVDWQKYE